MTHRYSFAKQEKLCGRLPIKTLYDKGKRKTCYPLRISWSVTQGEKSYLPKVLIWAPKSFVKKATERNRIRRQMREAYRLNSLQLKNYCADNNICMQVAFNYIANEMMQYEQIEKAMKKAIVQLTTNEDADS